MKRFYLPVLCLVSVSTGALWAQDAAAMLQDLNFNYNDIKNNVLGAAEKMPEGDYSFQPTPDVRTFGGWVQHLAQAQTGICSSVLGQPPSGGAGSAMTKEQLVAAVKASFAVCDKAYAETTAANHDAPVMMFGRSVPRASALYGNFAHSMEGYGAMAVYLRMKGIVPPSTERGMAGKKGMKKN
jgi:uncharacterized damage-inducible protein DinB